MLILELFAGSRSLGKVAESGGHEVFSIDIEKFDQPTELEEIDDEVACDTCVL